MKPGSTTSRSAPQAPGTPMPSGARLKPPLRSPGLSLATSLVLALSLALALASVLSFVAMAGPASARTPWLAGAALCDALALLLAVIALPRLRRAEADRAGALARVDELLAEQRASAEGSARQLLAARQRRDEAEAASRAKDEFLALFDHELRNPIGAISSAVRVLQHERIGADQSRNALDIIARQNGRLGQLLKDLLDAAQVASGEVVLVRQAMDLAGAAERAASALRGDGAMQHHDVAMQLQPAWIDADALRIEQIARQALLGAFRSIPAGGRVLLAVGVEAGEACLSVHEEGHAASAAEVPRAGLGSALAQGLVALHGGRARIDAAGFEMRLPAIAPPAAERASTPRGKPRSVALIQPGDEAAALESMLALDGHDVSRHDEALGGLQAVVDARPEVTIVDLALPGLGGFDLARRCRAAGYAGLMIAISGVQAQADTQRAMQAGFDAHLLQPVDAERLRELMRQLW